VRILWWILLRFELLFTESIVSRESSGRDKTGFYKRYFLKIKLCTDRALCRFDNNTFARKVTSVINKHFNKLLLESIQRVSNFFFLQFMSPFVWLKNLLYFLYSINKFICLLEVYSKFLLSNFYYSNHRK
jgi:hypothetical protein